MNTLNKIDKYIKTDNDNLDDEMMDKMFDFMQNLDLEQIPEHMASDYIEIIDGIAGETDDVTEGFAKKKVKIKASEKRKRKMEYRKKRSQLKLKAKKYRRTTKYKQYKRKAKRKAKQGKTSTGKRIRKFI